MELGSTPQCAGVHLQPCDLLMHVVSSHSKRCQWFRKTGRLQAAFVVSRPRATAVPASKCNSPTSSHKVRTEIRSHGWNCHIQRDHHVNFKNEAVKAAHFCAECLAVSAV